MPDQRWLVLRLEAPLLAFGGVRIDHIGITRDFPAASMLTGLLGNALGYRRTDWALHQSLQDRLVFAARRDRGNLAGLLVDMQNAKLEKGDRGWTTRGVPEGRDGDSYDAPHRRQRSYHMDALVTVVLRLEDGTDPDLDVLAAALDRPVRPLFIGRKPCLPTGRIVGGFIQAADAFAALAQLPCEGDRSVRACWPADQGPVDGDGVDCVVNLPDLRNWRTGLHGGTRRVVEGRIAAREVSA